MWAALQSERLFDADKFNPGERKRFDPSSGLVGSLIQAYEQADHWRTKRQILSLFADDFSRAELEEMIPGLSKWRIDQACQQATEAGKGNRWRGMSIKCRTLEKIESENGRNCV